MGGGDEVVDNRKFAMLVAMLAIELLHSIDCMTFWDCVDPMACAVRSNQG